MTHWSDFWHQARYVVLFYVVGDLLTTYIGITRGYGFEYNPLLEIFGFTGIYLIKFGFLCFMSYLYIRTLDKPFLWHFARHTSVFLGLLATVNNLLVIHAGYSIFQQVI